uniref:Uncharacterized protein n=1 Tax=Meloidogyne enterolobii TaxID=390850 RepID=A0A6V7VMW1_MELEN|nr:unnamed protein product [Meloidogyne enterolobii]
MFVLPTEVQLDLTNFYFYNLINKYEGELARMKFNSFYFNDTNPKSNYDIIEPKSGVFSLTLNDQLKNKWQVAIDRSIPLLLHEFKPERTFVVISTVDKKTKSLLLKLPNFPKNIEEMIEIRCCLEHLFKCVFVGAYISTTIFNPEMINILFDNDKTTPLQFNFQILFLYAKNKIFENVLKFVSNHLTISKFFNISFIGVIITEQRTNILFNILINEGNKFSKIRLEISNLSRLYDSIINVHKFR